MVLQQTIKLEIIEDAFYKDDGAVMLDEAMSLVDAVEPAFSGDGTLTGLLLQPADTPIIRPSADKTDYLSISIANGENDPAGEIIAIIA